MDILNLLNHQVPNPVDLASTIVFGRYLKASDRAYLLANSKVKEFHKGDVICRQSFLENNAYLILQGEVEVSETVNDTVVPLGVLGPSDLFGEVSALCSVPRIATVTALEHCVMLEIPPGTLQQLIVTTPNLQKPIYHYLYERAFKTAMSAAPHMHAK